MNPGPAEEVGKVATGFIDSMKSQPLALALCLVNIGLLLLFWGIMDRVADTRHREMDQMFADQKEIRNILTNCVVPPKT